MTTLPPRRWVTLRIRAPASERTPTLRADVDADAMDALLEKARGCGLPDVEDPGARALLAAVRLRDDVPPLLYSALAVVLSRVLAAADACAAHGDGPDR